MTSAELASVLNLKETYLRKHFPYIVSTYKRMNVEIYKNGRGKNAEYGYKGYGMTDVAWKVEEVPFYNDK